MTDVDSTDFVPFAAELADAARAETLPHFAAGVVPENKAGGGRFDPVTEADRAAEQAMRRLIEARYPKHGIVGEEFSDRRSTDPHCWYLDPIDGTGSFLCGLPSWVTLIALAKDDAPLLGLIDAPRLGERYIGGGDSAWLITGNRTRTLATSDCQRLAEARLSTTDPTLFEGEAAQGFERIRKEARLTRYGHDGYAYARLADGMIDLVVESGLKPHDVQALIPVVRGAGGVIGNWQGGGDCSAGAVVAAASLQLFDEAVALLGH